MDKCRHVRAVGPVFPPLALFPPRPARGDGGPIGAEVRVGEAHTVFSGRRAARFFFLVLLEIIDCVHLPRD